MIAREREDAAPRRFLPELVLVGITILWGGTFLVTKIGLADSGPLFFVGSRFAIAAILLAVLSPGLLRGWTVRDILAPALIGCTMVAGYALQTTGLQSIPSSMSAFLTALYVPFVPLLQLVLFRRVPGAMVWAGIVMAFFGLVLLAGPATIATLTLGYGELLSILSALAFAFQILFIGRFAGVVDPRRAALVQLATVAIGSYALMPLTGEHLPALTSPLIACALALGVASAVIQVAMNWGQAHVAPARATLIYAAEPVYAGLIGWIAGERFTQFGLVGAVLIVSSVVVSELKLKRD
ncbi:DMT family transporter [Sphingomonas prati]|uniref:Drug/metabolite transporter (DMT)-like permease n=1 Tax=Sphingomonas prati TaxID=1843237 RepID=A0A7W9BQZ4_9SPHN|nr:DMT family transporter [Sphingomonas prati]MBB5728519.1 drug/metabolite transporter (DMT)-like permease [Sphingomonas prati]GGE73162.1 transporter [Sphingomonas prati]